MWICIYHAGLVSHWCLPPCKSTLHPPICCQTYYHTGCIGGPQYNSYTHLHPLLDTCRESNLHLWKSQEKYFKISGPWKEGRCMLLRRREIYNVFKNLRYYAIRLTVIVMLFFSQRHTGKNTVFGKKSFYFQFGPNGIFYLSQLCWCKYKLLKMCLCAALEGVNGFNHSCDIFHQN